MKKLASALLPILFLVAACGGNDAADVSVMTEAAGANCANGGVRITVDDKSYYACNGVEGAVGEEGPAGSAGSVGPVGADGVEGSVGADGKSPVITTEQVAAGEEGNPCEGPALKVTVVPADESEAVVEYVCQAYEPVFENIMEPLLRVLANQLPRQTVERLCTCSYNAGDSSYESIEDCVNDSVPADYITRYQNQCMGEAYARYGEPAPQVFVDVMTCLDDAYSEMESCLSALNQQECSPEFEAEIRACSDAHQQAASPCMGDATDDEEITEWMNGYIFFVDQMQCI